MPRERYYRPTTYGLENEIKDRLDRWADLRRKKSREP
jgi:replication-associated recombination protein RarA